MAGSSRAAFAVGEFAAVTLVGPSEDKVYAECAVLCYEEDCCVICIPSSGTSLAPSDADWDKVAASGPASG